MKAMNKVRKLLRRNWTKLTQRQAADMVGVSTTTVSKFLSGIDGSPTIAKWAAEKYGGQFIPLYAQVQRDMSYSFKEKAAYARKTKADKKAKYQKTSYDYPDDEIGPPTDYVPMSAYTQLNHIDIGLLPIPRDITAYSLPLVAA